MKIIVPVSGGIDSAYLVWLAYSENHEVTALIFDDGDSEHVENRSAFAIATIANYSGVVKDVRVMPLPYLKGLEVCYPIKLNEHAEPLQSNEGAKYWSGYKGLMYANALSLGGAIGADQVWWGVYRWNKHYQDEQPESAEAFQNVWKTMYPELHVPVMHFPLWDCDKSDIIRKAKSLNVPLHLTISCFQPKGSTHCGVCQGCIHRKEEFLHAGIEDPANYIRG